MRLPTLCLQESALILTLMVLWFLAIELGPDHGREAASPDLRLAEASL